MLTALHIQDFVLIDALSAPLERGMTALTGETGAGKSILLDALGLAAGARASRAAVRAGATRGVVAASFEPRGDHPVWPLLEENGVAADDGQIILRRVQTADGRGRAFVNDQPVSVALLREVGGALLEIHGQHDGRGFLSASTHRALLDEFAGLRSAAAALAATHRALRDAEAASEARAAARDAAAREKDYLRHVVDELSALAPAPGEDAALAERRQRLMTAEKVAGDLADAQRLLSEDGLDGKLSACARRLAKAGDAAPGAALGEAVDKIETALSALMEAAAAVDGAADALEADAAALEEAEARLFALRAAARKHGVTPDELPRTLDQAARALDDLDAGDEAFAELGARRGELQAAYDEAAAALSDRRRAAGARLDEAVASELAPLKLGRAAFTTRVATDPDERRPHGVDDVEFMVATNPGAPAGPLKTIASGGELSRFVLAMKAALAAKEDRTVIIFDEIDAGVGGAVADAVGERLARLARDAQVLVVTHSPQVAARADAHWVVEKTQTDDDTRTRVRALDAGARVDEIARMLSGAEVTAEARAAAARLLGKPAPGGEAASRPRAKRRAPKKTA
ncbi:MAG: DNA repair protein RecN [Parvularculaceae bacterium]